MWPNSKSLSFWEFLRSHNFLAIILSCLSFYRLLFVLLRLNSLWGWRRCDFIKSAHLRRRHAICISWWRNRLVTMLRRWCASNSIKLYQNSYWDRLLDLSVAALLLSIEVANTCRIPCFCLYFVWICLMVSLRAPLLCLTNCSSSVIEYIPQSAWLMLFDLIKIGDWVSGTFLFMII